MRKIIGIGETIMDIIFRDGQPSAAVPGGSVFNSMVSLGRLHQQVTMISETGNDRVGRLILDFMAENGVDNRWVATYATGRSAISLAWLNERNDAEYMFYKDYPAARLEVGEWPAIEPNDIVMMGSYFVLNPVLRPRVKDFLDYARSHGALIYYDLNFRSSHRHEREAIFADMIANLDYADIVRGSTEDLDNLFGCSDPEQVYREHISAHCAQMLCTDADGDVRLFTASGLNECIPVERIPTVSTIGAGDNFNAGIAYGLIRYGILREALPALGSTQWHKVIACGTALASEVCQTLDNSVSRQWAEHFLISNTKQTTQE